MSRLVLLFCLIHTYPETPHWCNGACDRCYFSERFSERRGLLDPQKFATIIALGEFMIEYENMLKKGCLVWNLDCQGRFLVQARCSCLMLDEVGHGTSSLNAQAPLAAERLG